MAVFGAGCGPFGYDVHVDTVEVRPGSIVARGWVHDAFAQREHGCPAMRVSVDGVRQSSSAPCPVFGSRPDVDAVMGGRNAALPEMPISGLGRGAHRLCVDVVAGSSVAAAAFEPATCTDVVVPFDQHDRSALDMVVVGGTRVEAAGWYSQVTTDPQPGGFVPSWSLDGLWIGDIRALSFTEGRTQRPDVALVHGPRAEGFTLVIDSLAAGSHRLCLGLKSQTSGNLSGVISCRSFTV